MAKRRPDLSDLPDSNGIQPPIHTVHLEPTSNNVTIYSIPSISCESGASVSNNHNSSNVSQTNSNTDLTLESITTSEPLTGILFHNPRTENSDDFSGNKTRNEEEVKTVDDLFSFINEGFHHVDELENKPKQTTRQVQGAGQTTTSYGRVKGSSLSVVPQPPTSIDLALSTDTEHTYTSNDLNNRGNLVNFNRQESVKIPSPMKEIDMFLPEEETIDLSLTTRSWKGRAPPTHLFEVNYNDKDNSEAQFTDMEIKISNQDNRDVPYLLSDRNTSTKVPDLHQLGPSRIRTGSFENIPGTGQHIRSIQVKREPSLASAPTKRKLDEGQIVQHLETDTDTEKRTIEDGTIMNKRSSMHSPLSRLEYNNKTTTINDPGYQSKSDMKSQKGIENGILPPLPLEKVKGFTVDETLIVDLTKTDLKNSNHKSGQRLHKDRKVSSGRATDIKYIPSRSIKEIHGNLKENITQATTKQNISQTDSVDAKEEFNIYGMVTQANNQNRYASGSVSTNGLNQLHVAVDANPTMSCQDSHDGQYHQFGLSERLPLQRQNGTDNINLYVNVNLNMNPERKPRGGRPTITSPGYPGYMDMISTDFRGPMVTCQDLSDSTDKSQTSSTYSDDERSSSDPSSSSQSDFSTQDLGKGGFNYHTQMPNNLSTIDKFLMHNNLGPGGLSPIPSESYESDSTHRQIDSSGCDDDNMTPTGSQYSLASSETTLKEFISDELDDPRPSKRNRSSLKRDSTNTKTRKIQHEEEKYSLRSYNEAECDTESRRRGSQAAWKKLDYQPRSIVCRSVSQPEQFLLDKRNAFINRMRLNTEYDTQTRAKFITHSSSHKRLKKTISEPIEHSKQLQKDGYDARLPLNVQLPADVLSSEDNDGSTAGTSRGTKDTDPRFSSFRITRQEFSRSSWHHKSPYSSIISRSSSVLSVGSRSGRRIRQLSVDIGEEWENVNFPQRARTCSDVGSVSSGAFSYRSLRSNSVAIRDRVNSMHLQNREFVPEPDEFIPTDLQATEEIDSPIAQLEEEKELSDRHIVDVPRPVVIEVASTEEDDFSISSPKKRILLNNPYNSINQKFHSSLQCPCFLFFCFLCCAPAVYWMQRSDYEFDYSSEKLAKTFGRRATVLYIVGIVMSIVLLGTAVMLTYMLLQNEQMLDSTN